MHSLLKTSHSISLPADKVATTEAQAAGAVDLARGSTCKWKHMHTLLLVALLYALTVKNISQYFLASKQSGRRQLVSQALSVQQVLLELVKSNVGLQQLPGKEDFASLSGCAASSNLSPCSFAGPPVCTAAAFPHFINKTLVGFSKFQTACSSGGHSAKLSPCPPPLAGGQGLARTGAHQVRAKFRV